MSEMTPIIYDIENNNPVKDSTSERMKKFIYLSLSDYGILIRHPSQVSKR